MIFFCLFCCCVFCRETPSSGEHLQNPPDADWDGEVCCFRCISELRAKFRIHTHWHAHTHTRSSSHQLLAKALSVPLRKWPWRPKNRSWLAPEPGPSCSSVALTATGWHGNNEAISQPRARLPLDSSGTGVHGRGLTLCSVKHLVWYQCRDTYDSTEDIWLFITWWM